MGSPPTEISPLQTPWLEPLRHECYHYHGCQVHATNPRGPGNPSRLPCIIDVTYLAGGWIVGSTMRILRMRGIGALSLLLIWQAPALAAPLEVKQDPNGLATGYYLIPQESIEHLMRLARLPEEAQARRTLYRKIISEYTVHALDDVPNLTDGQYYVFAACRGRLRLSDNLISESKGRITLSCPLRP